MKNSILKTTVILPILLIISFGLFISFVHYNFEEVYVDFNTVTIEPEEDPVVNIPDVLKMVTTGDALIHIGLYKTAYRNGIYDFKPQLQYIKPIIEQYDLAYYNQETIFGGASLGYSNYPRFNTPSEFGDAMLDAGFNVVSLANNHSYDKGEKGLLNAVDYWKNTNIMYNGINNSPEMQRDIQIMTKNNISYALLSYTTLNNGLNTPAGKKYYVNYYSEELVKNDVEYLRERNVDVVMVAMHWGTEYTHKPIASQIKIANYLADLGVNVVIGTHPHVLMPITTIKDTLIIYSLGNFISCQNGIAKATGALVSYDIIKENNIITINNVKAELIYKYYDNNLKDYRVRPYSQLNDKILNNYKSAFESQKKIITNMDESIIVS